MSGLGKKRAHRRRAGDRALLAQPRRYARPPPPPPPGGLHRAPRESGREQAGAGAAASPPESAPVRGRGRQRWNPASRYCRRHRGRSRGGGRADGRPLQRSCSLRRAPPIKRRGGAPLPLGPAAGRWESGENACPLLAAPARSSEHFRGHFRGTPSPPFSVFPRPG